MFSESEIEKAKELKRLGFPKERGKEAPVWDPRKGHFIFARHCPEGCVEVSNQVFLIVDPNPSHKDYLWLPTIDDLLEIARKTQITFSFMTDYLHRKRFADQNEREGLYQMFIEKLR